MKPAAAVVVVCADPADPRVRAVLAGLEEEGVPACVEAAEGVDEALNARGLAGSGSDHAAFDVGIGIAADGSVSLRHARLSPDHLGPPRDLDSAHLRDLGQDAGRIVKRLPLQHVPEPPMEQEQS